MEAAQAKVEAEKAAAAAARAAVEAEEAVQLAGKECTSCLTLSGWMAMSEEK